MTEGTYEEDLEETSEETLENICYMRLYEIEKYVIAKTFGIKLNHWSTSTWEHPDSIDEGNALKILGEGLNSLYSCY